MWALVHAFGAWFCRWQCVCKRCWSCRRPRLCIRDVARAHPAQDFARGLDRRRVPACWPVAKLFLELVGDPAGLVSALLGNVGEHAMPSIFLDPVIMDDGSSALDETKLAGGGRNELRRTPGHEAALGTGLATNTQRAALRALDQFALMATLPLGMLGRRCSQIGIE